MTNKFKKLADYVATFCVNLAVIGIGLSVFEGRAGTFWLSVFALIFGAYVTWRTEK
ncbi:MAG: hypothetical protein RR088_04230 [Clostridia bacterium]